MNDDEIKKFLDDNADLFKSLADDLLCPCCKKVVKPPFFNLGDYYNSAEGCFDCYKFINETIVS